jgi:hypothetical protein
MRFLSLLFVLALTACANPSPFASGYTYHGDLYKAPPGPDARDIGYEYTLERNDNVVQIWRIVAQDLVSQLEERTGLGAQPIYIEAEENPNAFNASFDNALREQFVERGFTVNATPEGALYLRYNAEEAKTEENVPGNPEGFGDYVMTLQTLDLTGKEEVVTSEVGGVYKLPSYGYNARSYRRILKPITGGAL